jgi:hypothetical protein
MTGRWIMFVVLCCLIPAAGCGRARSTGDGAETPERNEAEIRAANEAAGAVATLLPVDESGRDPAFHAFHAALAAAVARRDTAALLAVVDPKIRTSFGDDNGIEAFRARWLGPDARENLWHELGDVLALGGTFSSDSQFVAPYTFSRWPESLDGFEHVAVTAADVPVRTAPLDDATVLATVSYAIFRLDPNRALANALDGWTVIDRGADTPGFIETGHVRSPMNYRAFFQRQAGTWRMNLLIAGD